MIRERRASAEKPPKTTEWAAEAGAGEHRDDRLRDHRQVDRDPVSGLDPEFGECVRRLRHLGEELGIRQRPGVPGLAFEVDGHPVAVAGEDMPVEAVVRDVELSVGEPLGERRVRPVEHLGEVVLPVDEFTGLLGPEALEVLGTALIGVFPDIGGGRELLWRGEGLGRLGAVGHDSLRLL